MCGNEINDIKMKKRRINLFSSRYLTPNINITPIPIKLISEKGSRCKTNFFGEL